ncbi:E3 ubiquitin-protein ligase DTX3L isoform X2 [Microtus pennsylvanicus]|uniref:E3 ubiquitin-protein ligase DTX3L isoform X2 n=1 Tax=Microtus pennsylvanicus TaxID=10058 RepID=UPI003F6B32E8
MASRPCPPSPLLVRLPESISRAHRKLEKYFQSRASEGGECTVQSLGPSAPDTFEVNFLQRAAKERVLKKREHQMEVDGKPVTIFLETTKKPVEVPSSSPPSLTQPAEAPSSSPPSVTQSAEAPSSRPPSVTQSLDEALSDEGPVYNSDDAIVQEVFLAVTAELNCELLSKEQRAYIASVCPGIRSVEGEDGIAKVCGSFKDIEKIHNFLTVQLLESEQKQKYPTHKYPPSDVERQPPNQQDSGMDFSSSEPKTGLDDDSENRVEVPLLLLEYFRHAYPDRIESIANKFGVSFEVRDSAPNMASVQFTTGQPGNLEAASQSFIRDFQRYTQALKQDCVSLEDPQRAMELRQELNRCFPQLLIKEQGRKLTLLGSQADISAATEKVSHTSFKTPVEIMSSGYMTGIEVDSTHFNLLKPALHQEISEIEQKYNTCVKVQEKTQKTCLLFVPRDKEVDLSVHSYASFTDAFQHAMCQLKTEILPLKHLGKGKAHLQKTKFVDDLKKTHPNVHFVVSKESMTLMGLPNQLAQAKQYMFKRIGLSLPSGESLNVDHETPMDIDANEASPPLRGSADSSGALKVNDNEDSCAICMDTIINKHVLPKCKHEFCSSCITKALSFKPVCPLCQTSYGIQKGNQPKGTMTSTTSRQSLPGYADCGSIVIQYIIESGIQTDEHPNPGKPYSGTRRTAYLPDNQEGRHVLGLLREAFKNRLIFTVGDSRVSGMSDVVTWNDIHHKTSTFGGPGNFGYPDPHYLTRVKAELKAKGIE